MSQPEFNEIIDSVKDQFTLLSTNGSESWVFNNHNQLWLNPVSHYLIHVYLGSDLKYVLGYGDGNKLHLIIQSVKDRVSLPVFGNVQADSPAEIDPEVKGIQEKINGLDVSLIQLNELRKKSAELDKELLRVNALICVYDDVLRFKSVVNDFINEQKGRGVF